MVISIHSLTSETILTEYTIKNFFFNLDALSDYYGYSFHIKDEHEFIRNSHTQLNYFIYTISSTVIKH